MSCHACIGQHLCQLFCILVSGSNSQCFACAALACIRVHAHVNAHAFCNHCFYFAVDTVVDTLAVHATFAATGSTCSNCTRCSSFFNFFFLLANFFWQTFVFGASKVFSVFFLHGLGNFANFFRRSFFALLCGMYHAHETLLFFAYCFLIKLNTFFTCVFFNCTFFLVLHVVIHGSHHAFDLGQFGLYPFWQVVVVTKDLFQSTSMANNSVNIVFGHTTFLIVFSLISYVNTRALFDFLYTFGCFFAGLECSICCLTFGRSFVTEFMFGNCTFVLGQLDWLAYTKRTEISFELVAFWTSSFGFASRGIIVFWLVNLLGTTVTVASNLASFCFFHVAILLATQCTLDSIGSNIAQHLVNFFLGTSNLVSKSNFVCWGC